MVVAAAAVGTTRPDGAVAPARRRRLHLHRAPLLATGVLVLIAATCGGLARLGVALPHDPKVTLVAFHGPLMVAGFLGTVIGLERAVALGRLWAYGGPLATAVGAIGVIAGLDGGPLALTVGSGWLVAVYAAILGRQSAMPTAVMGLGAVLWLAGQGLWLAGSPLHAVAPWWAAFLTLTIAGERLELSRLTAFAPTRPTAFVALVAAVVAGLVIGTIEPDLGARLVGLAYVSLAAWLWRRDIARRTVRQSGLTRFVAVALLAGYAWLGVSGLLALVWGGVPAGPRYDAILHAVFVGFVFSMIFGHAPIIFPAVLGPMVSYRPAFYAHLGLLHVGLVMRVAGDVAGIAALRRGGGVLNAVAIVLFLANTVYAIARPVTARAARPRSGGA
jgi:hypothetical protein